MTRAIILYGMKSDYDVLKGTDNDGNGNCPSIHDDDGDEAGSGGHRGIVVILHAILCKYTWKPLLENMTDSQSLINIQLR